MPVEQFDVVVVGGGTAGALAAATAGSEGVETVLLERKPADEAGHIACGDAVKSDTEFPAVIDRGRLREAAFTNRDMRRGVLEDPRTGETVELPFDGLISGVVDRKRYGEVLLSEAERSGAAIHYDTVVQDVRQDESGRVRGVRATRNGDPVTYEAEVVVDCAGSLSILQDEADFSGATFDTNVTYSQFCSAYREIVEVDEPVPWSDALYFKPIDELGYLWYFPRTPTEINVGVGFQMNEPPMRLVETLRDDLRSRPEFDGATVTDKLGAALPTRRPYDSAVAPGFLAAGDAAGHVNPTNGGGIEGAAQAGHFAGKTAVEAVSAGDASEAALWSYNRAVMGAFGGEFAAMDLYNIWAGGKDIDELTDVVTAVPGEQLVDVLGRDGTTAMDWPAKLRLAASTLDHWRLLLELARVHANAERMNDCYADYPEWPAGLADWQRHRDRILDRVYEIADVDPKY